MKYRAESAEPDHSSPLEPMDYVLLKTKLQQWMIRVSSIRMVQAQGHATIVGLEGDESVLVGRWFATWQKQLPAKMFLRVSRGLLVNLTYVVRLEAVTKESARLIFDGRSLPIELSRLEAAWVRKALGPGSPADRE